MPPQGLRLPFSAAMTSLVTFRSWVAVVVFLGVTVSSACAALNDPGPSRSAEPVTPTFMPATATPTPTPSVTPIPPPIDFTTLAPLPTRTGPSNGYAPGPTMPAGVAARAVGRGLGYVLLDTGFWVSPESPGLPPTLGPPACSSPWELSRAPGCPSLPAVLFDVPQRVDWPRTNIVDVDVVLAALQSHDRATLAAIQGGIEIDCEQLSRKRIERELTIFDTSRLPCQPGETRASIQVVRGGSHAGYASAVSASSENVRILVQPHWLYAIYRPNESSYFGRTAEYFESGSDADWVVILGTQSPVGSIAFLLREGKIIGRDIAWSWSGPGTFVRPSFESAEFLVPPP